MGFCSYIHFSRVEPRLFLLASHRAYSLFGSLTAPWPHGSKVTAQYPKACCHETHCKMNKADNGYRRCVERVFDKDRRTDEWTITQKQGVHCCIEVDPGMFRSLTLSQTQNFPTFTSFCFFLHNIT